MGGERNHILVEVEKKKSDGEKKKSTKSWLYFLWPSGHVSCDVAVSQRLPARHVTGPARERAYRIASCRVVSHYDVVSYLLFSYRRRRR